MKILVDCHEPDINIKYLKDLNFDVEKVLLPIGDYVCEEKNVCIGKK